MGALRALFGPGQQLVDRKRGQGDGHQACNERDAGAFTCLKRHGPKKAKGGHVVTAEG